ncbi:hypothetical protein EDEG_01511 [Edhazardia aedis USNM 41457]|uniref:Uncharacterized protein n=1 Tax=Edhazardia aedis (strain USNM 41457) TaxID=1003232 RepID=J9DSB6_EDHAE|nr:hypothetical protein EDEG_01511 [Edhazardia aedis USNM 41457]|eukprot:EJW04202.1 hypothetical protein EDEG_01511 [Edhazardia aedis USNM 41457]
MLQKEASEIIKFYERYMYFQKFLAASDPINKLTTADNKFCKNFDVTSLSNPFISTTSHFLDENRKYIENYNVIFKFYWRKFFNQVRIFEEKKHMVIDLDDFYKINQIKTIDEDLKNINFRSNILSSFYLPALNGRSKVEFKFYEFSQLLTLFSDVRLREYIENALTYKFEFQSQDENDVSHVNFYETKNNATQIVFTTEGIETLNNISLLARNLLNDFFYNRDYDVDSNPQKIVIPNTKEKILIEVRNWRSQQECNCKSHCECNECLDEIIVYVGLCQD